jgi:hypothetical protein
MLMHIGHDEELAIFLDIGFSELLFGVDGIVVFVREIALESNESPRIDKVQTKRILAMPPDPPPFERQ